MTGPTQRPARPTGLPVARPLDRPAAVSESPPKAPNSAEAGRYLEPTMGGLPLPHTHPVTPSSTGHPGPRTRVTQDQLERISLRLSQRDHDILDLVSRHRFASTAHIRELLFTGHASQSAATRATIRVLHRLLELRLLARLERRVGGAWRGSAASVWHLDGLGERLTRATPEAPRRRLGHASIEFLSHSLAVTDTHVTLATAAQESAAELARVEIETEAWRTYLSPAGSAVILQPDLAVTVSTPTYDDHFYLEVDRGTESLPVLLTKCRAYTTYWKSGRAQAEHGVFPRVIWIVPTQRRADRLTAAIADDAGLPARLFTAITPDQLIATVFDEEAPATDL